MSSVTYYCSDNVLEKFYDALANEDSSKLARVHIPRSDVFYVREAIYQDTGVRYTLDHVERAMWKEGHLETEDVLDPYRIRPWEKNYRQYEEDYGE